MMGVTRRSDYALVAMGELASRDRDLLSASAIAAETGLPDSLLRNLLKTLARAGMLTSVRGPFGGYALARPASDITVLEVVEAIDGPVEFVQCCGRGEETGEGHACLHASHCRIRGGMQRLHRDVRGLLARVTVMDLIATDLGERGEVVPLRVDDRCRTTDDDRKCRLGETTPAGGTKATLGKHPRTGKDAR